MKKRLISFMLLITVISCFGFNTDYFKNLLTLISQAAKEVIYEETESYDEETTDSAVDRLEQELEKLDVRNFFEDESETESGSKTNKLFKNQSLLYEHYGRHGQEIADVLGDSDYSIDKYLDDANYIINNGTYVPELNGYVSFISGEKYGFVGLDRTTGDITTFHIKNISELIKKAPSLGFER